MDASLTKSLFSTHPPADHFINAHFVLITIYRSHLPDYL